MKIAVQTKQLRRYIKDVPPGEVFVCGQQKHCRLAGQLGDHDVLASRMADSRIESFSKHSVEDLSCELAGDGSLNSLKAGDVFIFDGEWWLMTSAVACGRRCATRLSDGYHADFCGTEPPYFKAAKAEAVIVRAV